MKEEQTTSRVFISPTLSAWIKVNRLTNCTNMIALIKVLLILMLEGKLYTEYIFFELLFDCWLFNIFYSSPLHWRPSSATKKDAYKICSIAYFYGISFTWYLNLHCPVMYSIVTILKPIPTFNVIHIRKILPFETFNRRYSWLFKTWNWWKNIDY